MSGVAVVMLSDSPAFVGLDLTGGAADAALGELERDAPMPSAALAVLVVQAAAICDCLAAPGTIYVRDTSPGGTGGLVPRFPVTLSHDPDSTDPSAMLQGVEVGGYTEATALVSLNPSADGLSAEETERRAYLFALRRLVRRVPDAWRVGAPADRPAAGWPLLVAAGVARVVVALGVSAAAAYTLKEISEAVADAAVRRHALEVQAAGVQFETRFRDWQTRGRPAGGMMPPSDLERAVAARIRDDAREEWTEVLKETATTVAMWVGVAAVVFFVVRALSDGGKRNG